MLARAPRELCARSDFDRAVVSLLAEGAIVAEAVYFHDDEPGSGVALAALRAEPPRLDRPLIETEVLRRRRATIVVDADVNPRVDGGAARVMRWTTYAAAPLIVRSSVIGVIHADRGPGVALDVVDRDVLWEFTQGLARTYETASLRRTLRAEGDRMRGFVEWMGTRAGALGDVAGDLVAPGRAPLPSPEFADAPRGRLVPGRSIAVRRAADATRARRAAPARRRAEHEGHRSGAGAVAGDDQVPRQQHPAQAPRGEPGPGRVAVLRAAQRPLARPLTPANLTGMVANPDPTGGVWALSVT